MKGIQKEVNAVVVALLDCDTLEERADRTVCVKMLDNPDISARLKRSDNKQDDLREIVEACADFDDGVQALVLAVRSREGNSSAMPAVDQRAAALITRRSEVLAERERPPADEGGAIARIPVWIPPLRSS
jgi:hypothetical protein